MNGKGQGKAAGISNRLALLQATKCANSKSNLWFVQHNEQFSSKETSLYLRQLIK
jgi:hypothetical protein